MQDLTLKANVREGNQKPQPIREQGQIPAILYGHRVKNLSLKIDAKSFVDIFHKAHESTIFSLKVAGEKKPRNVIIKEVQRDPTSQAYLHVDFYQVKMSEKITAEVALKFTGRAPAVKELGGVLVKSLDSIEVSSLPADLPAEIEVPINGLETLDDVIYVKDLVVPAKVQVLERPDEAVVSVTPPRSEEELAELEEEVEEKVEEVEGVAKEEGEEEGEEEVLEPEEGKEGEGEDVVKESPEPEAKSK